MYLVDVDSGKTFKRLYLQPLLDAGQLKRPFWAERAYLHKSMRGLRNELFCTVVSHIAIGYYKCKGGVVSMFSRKRYLYLSNDELSVLLRSLVRLKNSLIQQGRYTDCVDDLIWKVMECPVVYMSS